MIPVAAILENKLLVSKLLNVVNLSMASSLGRMTLVNLHIRDGRLCTLHVTRELRHPPIPENDVTGLYS
jgi:hypothetical protein